MSEFTYACPWCGQHIRCDSSQTGTQMQCPTCFQNIIVPQAPTGQQTFILTGTKVAGERPLPKFPDDRPSLPRPGGFPGAIVVIIILICIIAAVGYVYRGTIFKKHAPQAVVQTPPPKPTPPPPAPPPPAAPQLDDTNWTLSLNGMAIPNAAAAGRVNGKKFVCKEATFTGGFFSLHDGNLGVGIDFPGADAQLLSGKTINVGTNAASAAHVVLRWKVGDQTMREFFTNGYALLLDFDTATTNRIGGKIYLCTSDIAKSYVAGTFNAEIRKRRERYQ